MTAIRSCVSLLLLLALAIPANGPANAQIIYSTEEEDGSVTFTHYRNRDDLEVFIDEGLEGRPESFAEIDPEAMYANLDRYDDLILAEAARQGVSPALVKAMMLVESGFNSRALSPAGAQGLMQLMPATASEVGVRDPWDPADNIAGGVRYLRKMIEHFGGNQDKAVAAYNAGAANVEKFGGTPPFEETQFYVSAVSRFYDYFATERPLRGSR